MRTQAEIDWEEKYGGLSDQELQEKMKSGISQKLSAYRGAKEQEKSEKELEKSKLTYPVLCREIPVLKIELEKIKKIPEELQRKKKDELNKEFDNELKFDRISKNNKELWVSERLVKYMMSDPEYLQANVDISETKKKIDDYVSLKNKWEIDNKDVIEAERIRTKRAELLSADPEALKALGIAPDPIRERVRISRSAEDEKMFRALRNIHPSASDAEIESMMRS